MQFMNSSLDALVKDLSNNEFKYFSKKKKNSSDLLELVKQIAVYPYE